MHVKVKCSEGHEKTFRGPLAIRRSSKWVKKHLHRKEDKSCSTKS